MTHTCRICHRTPDQTAFFSNNKGQPLSVCVTCMAEQRKADNPQAAKAFIRLFARKVTPAIAKMKREGTW